MSRKPYLAAIALAALLAAGAVIYARSHTGAVSSPAQISIQPGSISGHVPNVNGTAMDGRPVSLRADRGRPMLINFFAWWCDPCKREAPALATLGREFAGRVTMLAVSTDGSRSKTTAFVRQYGWTWPIVLDGNLTWANAFQITGQPWTFLVNSRGQIVWKHPGAISVGAVRSALHRLLRA